MRGLTLTLLSSSQGRIRTDILVVHKDCVRATKGVGSTRTFVSFSHSAGELMGLVSSASFFHTKLGDELIHHPRSAIRWVCLPICYLGGYRLGTAELAGSEDSSWGRGLQLSDLSISFFGLSVSVHSEHVYVWKSQDDFCEIVLSFQ